MWNTTIKVWLTRIGSALASIVGFTGRLASEISWRKVLFVTILASLLLAFGSVLLSFSKSLDEAFRAVFPNATSGTIDGGTFGLGVLTNVAVDKIFTLLNAIPLAQKLIYVLGLDWVFWLVSQLLLLWLAEYGIHRLMIWGGTMVRVAYDAL